MPGWHEATGKLRDAGRWQMVGIVQEQHPDRARLFMQWKKMDWPVLVDSLDLLGVAVVPVTLAIDEHGIIRLVKPPPGEIEQQFLDRTFAKPSEAPRPPILAPLRKTTPGEGAGARPQGTAFGDRRNYADACVMSGEAKLYGVAIGTYRELLQLAPGNGSLHFSLGVAYRMRYDSEAR